MRPIAAFLLLLLLACAVPARAAVRLVAPEARALRAGDSVELRWEGLDPAVTEVEFELSLDGGRWIRVSPELDALEQRWVWRVPALASENARLRLRCGGVRREEVAATSAAFRIDVVPGDDREFLGEWWPQLDRTSSSAAPIGLAADEGPVLAPEAVMHHADVPASPTLATPCGDGVALSLETSLAPPSTLRHARSARPAFVPLRN